MYMYYNICTKYSKFDVDRRYYIYVRYSVHTIYIYIYIYIHTRR